MQHKELLNLIDARKKMPSRPCTIYLSFHKSAAKNAGLGSIFDTQRYCNFRYLYCIQDTFHIESILQYLSVTPLCKRYSYFQIASTA